MLSLTYLSTASQPYSEAALADLLMYSRARNHADELTGMLLYDGGHFIQTLEGAQDAVDATFTRIKNDTRHRNLHVELREEIQTRSFADWSMGFESVTPDVAARLPGFNDYLDVTARQGERRDHFGRAGIFHRMFRDHMR